jgi:hypothetical protein
VTASEKAIRSKSKAHIQYKLANGTNVPGTTTVVGILDKPALKFWANKIGLQGIKMSDYVDALANVGKAAHAAILAELSGKAAESAFVDLAPDIRSLAENCYLSYREWANRHMLVPISMETPLVSESLRYGGTADFVGIVDGELELIEFKTGGIWPEHFIQLAAYAQLLEENKVVDKPIARFRVLSIPRAETETFDEKTKASVRVEWEIFRHCLAIHELKKEL